MIHFRWNDEQFCRIMEKNVAHLFAIISVQKLATKMRFGNNNLKRLIFLVQNVRSCVCVHGKNGKQKIDVELWFGTVRAMRVCGCALARV